MHDKNAFYDHEKTTEKKVSTEWKRNYIKYMRK